jgi:ribosomal protein L40E
MFDVGKICPKCNSTELGEGILSGEQSLRPKGKIFTMGSPIVATVCTKCGHIVDMKVKDPEKFIDTKKNKL